MGAFVDQFGVALGHRRQLPPQPFRRKLDGSQRVFDLMGDTTGNFAPRLDPLDLGNLAHVLEEQSRAEFPFALRPVAVIAQRACGNHQFGLGSADLQLD